MVFSKKELAVKLDLVSPSGVPYYEKLHKKILVPILVDQEKMYTENELKKIRVFDIFASMRLARILNLDI